MTKYITRADLKAWLDEILKENTLIAPVEEAGLTFFQPVETTEKIAFGFTNTAVSPKGWFFQQTEVLHGEEKSNGYRELKPETVGRNAVIFGIRPCDARGLTVTDKIFFLTPGDTSYIERRLRTTLIGLACLKERPECFCTRMGSSPNDASAVDILLSEAGDGYLVQAVTEKGSALAAKAKMQQSDLRLPAPVPAKPQPRQPLKAAGPSPDMAYWDGVADRCIHCNVCAFVCPTCYCFETFDIVSEPVAARSPESRPVGTGVQPAQKSEEKPVVAGLQPAQKSVERIRSWYTCQSPQFERIEGYITDAPKGVRLRHRFYHKLPIFPEQLGSGYATCTGCGRCVKACPVNIDIREIIDDVAALRASAANATTPTATTPTTAAA